MHRAQILPSYKSYSCNPTIPSILIILPILIILSTSCTPSWEKKLKQADPSTLYGNNFEGFELVKHEPMHDEEMYTFTKTDGDTLKKFLFIEGKEGNDTYFDLLEYEKEFPCNGDTCMVLMNGPDTLFYFRRKMGNRAFVVGEYSYRYRTGDMDSAEKEVYSAHRDSLRKVRGNGLRKLGN